MLNEIILFIYFKKFLLGVFYILGIGLDYGDIDKMMNEVV